MKAFKLGARGPTGVLSIPRLVKTELNQSENASSKSLMRIVQARTSISICSTKSLACCSIHLPPVEKVHGVTNTRRLATLINAKANTCRGPVEVQLRLLQG